VELAATGGSTRVLAYLVEQGARIDTLVTSQANSVNHPQVCHLLEQNRSGRTPLLRCMENGHMEVFELLRWRGAEARQSLDPKYAAKVRRLWWTEPQEHVAGVQCVHFG
jgi:hypothetical protein